MRNRKRILSVMLAALLVLTMAGSVFAEEELPVKLWLEPSANTVRAGQVFRVNIHLDFDSNGMAAAGGIMVLKWVLKFDPERLTIVDPYTLSPVTFDGEGQPAEGSLYRFGDIGLKESMEIRANAEGSRIVMLYSALEAESDIIEPGAFVQLAFQPKADLEIHDRDTILIEVAEPEVSAVNRDAKLSISGETLQMTVTPSFTVPAISAHRQNSTLTISGRAGAADKGNDITVEISKGGNVIDSRTERLDSVLYSMDFILDEARYPAGQYQVSFRSGNGSATRFLEVIEKDAVLPDEPGTDPDPGTDPNPGTDPDPGTKPDEPSKPDTGNTDKPGGNTGGSSKPGGGTGSSSSGGSSNPGGSGTAGTVIPSVPNDTTAYPTDITGHWAADTIQYVYRHSLMNGYLDGTFHPNGSITRAEFSTVMMRYLGFDQAPASADGFDDMAGHWAKGAVGALASRKIVSGISEHAFNPDAQITREEMAVILGRALQLPAAEQEADFTDRAEISSWAVDGVNRAAAAGIMKGDETGAFLPRNSATRAETATVIRRLHEAANAQ